MKTTQLKTILGFVAALGIAGSTHAAAQTDIIQDNFSPANFTGFGGSTGYAPDIVDQPGSTYYGSGAGYFFGTTPPGGIGYAGGQFQNKDSGGHQGTLDISIASAGSYVKPTNFLGISFTGSFYTTDPTIHTYAYVGFNAAQNTNGIDIDGNYAPPGGVNGTNTPSGATPSGAWATFNGLSVDDTGNLNLVYNGSIIDSTYVGLGFQNYMYNNDGHNDGGTFTLAYSLDPTAGNIYDFSLTYGSNVDTTLPWDTTGLFDDANTNYAEFGKAGAAGLNINEFAVTPEPSTWALMSGGLVVLLVWSRRRAAQV